jgi:sarcosine oxidase
LVDEAQHKYDVIVIGCGVWGAATLWALAKRGYRVLGLDQHTPPHKHGSHGGATRLARMSNSTGTQYTRLTSASMDLWRELGSEVGKQIVVKTGTMFAGEVGSLWFDNTLANLADSGFEYEVMTPETAMQRIPGLRIKASESVVWEPSGGIILVEPAIIGLHQVARELGAELMFDQPVLDWGANSQGVEVRTPQARYTADKLVVATGAFTEALLALDLPMAVERQILFNFPVPHGTPALPSLYFAAPPGVQAAPAYGCPEPDGNYKVSVASSGDPLVPEAMTQTITNADIKRVRKVVKERLPMLGEEPVASNVCMWSEVRDGHWLLGKHPLHERVVFGAGCNGRGFRFGAIIGELLSDLVEERHDDPALSFFAPERFETQTLD